MDRLEAMSLLLKVVEEGSFSAASRELNVPLATLSRKISDLEALLGTRLLMRSTRKLTLTDVGADYLSAARRILEQVEEAENQAAGEYTAPKGELIVTAPLMFGRLYVLPVIAGFLAQYPEICVRLLLTDRNVDLIEDHVDMAVRIGPLPDSTMVASAIGTLRIITCGSPQLLARHGVPQHPEDLMTMPCINVETPMPSSGWRYLTPTKGLEIEVPVRPRLAVTTPEAAVQAAVLDVGMVRLLQYQVREPIQNNILQPVLEAFEPPKTPVHLMHTSRKLMPQKMRCFMDFAVPELRQMLEFR